MNTPPRILPSLIGGCLLIGLTLNATWSVQAPATVTGAEQQAVEFLELLDGDQLEVAVLPYDAESRVGWHFIPKQTRKGLVLRDMSEKQQAAALELLQASLSEAGYKKARTIMSLEELLFTLEGPASRERRDPLKYYVTLFGDPRQDNRWGLSFEGHHLSLNFVFEDDQFVSSTPQFFATNPATINNKNELGFELGMQILKVEEQVAFELVNSLKPGQLKQAMIDETAPREIRNAGEKHPPQTEPVGIPASALSASQKKMLRTLVNEYATVIPEKSAKLRLKAIQEDGFENVHFAWAGATKPGIGHYYRIQGESFLIEFVNTQPDAAGNPANHVHCVWRDMAGDFALPIR